MIYYTYLHVCTCMYSTKYAIHVYVHVHIYMTSVFLISSYGAPLVQRAFYLAWPQFSPWARGAVNYDHIVTNSINSLLIASRCILNGAHTNHF